MNMPIEKYVVKISIAKIKNRLSDVIPKESLDIKP